MENQTPGSPNKKLNFEQIREKLCLERSPEAHKKRLELFKKFDLNKNGCLTLRECDYGVKNVLNLPEIGECKPVLFKAFEAAKTSAKNNSSLSDKTVEKNEFRYFLCYLRQYFEYYIMFNKINIDGNNYIDYEEFLKAVPLIENWGCKIEDPRKSYEEIDSDKSGLVRFDEFCSWAIKKNLDLEDDDDFYDKCFKNLK